MILDDIAASTKKRIAREKELMAPREAQKSAEAVSGAAKNSFKNALKIKSRPAAKINYICEIKKASPSRGIIADDFPYIEIAKEYEAAGAAAISVLTEPDFFMGSGNYLKDISRAVKLPLLKKDFIIDEYQIYQGVLEGASAVLLICALLDGVLLKRFIKIAAELPLDVLVETHDEAEIKMALECGAEIIGVNNRDLKTFSVDINRCIALRNFVPQDKVFVAESGIKSRDDIKKLAECGVDAVLIGEAAMLAKDRFEFLSL